MHTCGLCDPLCNQHTESPPPPTYSRGKERIDYILISTGLLPSVIRSGIFPYDQIFLADHHPCYVDLDSTLLFQEGTPSIAPHQYRGLQTGDPRLTEEYEAVVTQQIRHHRIEERIQELQQAGEKKIPKKATNTYAWSPYSSEQYLP